MVLKLADLAGQIKFGSQAIAIEFDSAEMARVALRKWELYFANWARKLGAPYLEVRCPGKAKPFRVKASLGMGWELPNDDELTVEGAPMIDLFGADYLRILDFLRDQRQSGNIVIITSNITRDIEGRAITTDNPQTGHDLCHHTSDLLMPSRAYWSASQFTGYNYRLSWRRDRNDYSRLNPEYQRLKDLLARDGMVNGYEYTLYRPDDALCRYSTSYFLCRDYCGDEVRIGVSRPQDWQLIEPAPELVEG